jgi:Na+/H+-dicarboxylate symporter
MFRKMPVILLALIILVGVSCQWLPLTLKSILYGMSLSLKSVIVFILPFMIFGLIFNTAAQMAKQASKWIFLILALVCISNFTSTIIAYFIGGFVFQFDLTMAVPLEGNSLTPLWNFTLPTLIGNGQSMFAGLFLGIILGWLKPALAQKTAARFNKMVSFLLKGILCIIPLFISGFIVKMVHDQMMSHILQNYILIFAVIAVSVLSYIGFLFLFVNNFKQKTFIESLKNMLPAALVGCGSMSSAAAMPLTILGAEKSSKNPEIAKSIIPVTVNIHLIGDCFAIPIFAFAIMKSFGLAAPDFSTYVIFAAYFVLAKFSVAAVPGGGILVMIPVLESYLGFNSEMLSLITALYILFDPITTPANIVGNGAIAMGIGNFSSRKAKVPVASQVEEQ